jgi:hypothetical protein
MTDASDLPPEQEAVRRLLADARHDGPPPADVVARLDETLAALVADRGSNPLDTSRPDSSDREAAVVDLASRRRRMAGVGLLAAASVVVAGVAIGQVLPRGSEDSGMAGADSSVEDAPAEAEAGSDFQSEDTDDSGAGSAELGPESLKSTAPTPLAGYPTLSSTDEALEERVLELRPAAVARSQYLGSADALGSCALPSLGPGRRLLAEVDGALGVVVFRRPDGGAQQAELYVCGTPDPVRTLTLPAP